MTNEEASVFLSDMESRIESKTVLNHVRKEALRMAIKALEKQDVLDKTVGDLISRSDAIDIINVFAERFNRYIGTPNDSEVYAYARGLLLSIESDIRALQSAQPDLGKYEYHYDHTDCIWYRPEARNRCPVTCAQYRDGWNDAMNYIFRDGKGYRPYRRGEQYEE